MIDSNHLARALTERFGLDVTVNSHLENDGLRVIIYPSGVARTLSYKIELRLGWRVIEALFIPGNFANDLMQGIRSASSTQKSAFSVFSKSLEAKGATVSLLFDNQQVCPSNTDSWPEGWAKVQISMKKIGVLVEKSSGYDFDAIFPWATGFFGLTLALLPLEEIVDLDNEGKSEGKSFYKQVKMYERSRLNRAACIEIHGSKCSICNFCFSQFYGALGEGYIHIHHIVPVSVLGGSYILNPEKDLIPVCPNCHAMIHRLNPALSPDELVKLMKETRNG